MKRKTTVLFGLSLTLTAAACAAPPRRARVDPTPVAEAAGIPAPEPEPVVPPPAPTLPLPPARAQAAITTAPVRRASVRTSKARTRKVDPWALKAELVHEGTTEAALARREHYRPLCDADGYPLVGNVMGKSLPEEREGPQPSDICDAIRAEDSTTKSDGKSGGKR